MSFDFNFDFNAGLVGTTFSAENEPMTGSQYWSSARGILNLSDNSNGTASSWSSNLGYNQIGSMINRLLGGQTLDSNHLKDVVPVVKIASKGNGLELPSKLSKVQFNQKYGPLENASEINAAYETYQTMYKAVQNYMRNLNDFLNYNRSSSNRINMTDAEMQSMVQIATDKMFGYTPQEGDLGTRNYDAMESQKAQMLNALISSKWIADAGAKPSSYGLTSAKFETVIDQLNTHTEDPFYRSFIIEIKNFVGTYTPEAAKTTLDNFLNSYYTDTINPAIVEDAVKMGYINPNRASISPPEYKYLDQTFNIDLNSPANVALYSAALQAYAVSNNLTAAQIKQIQNVHQDPTLNNPFAQRANLQIMASVLATLAKTGEINITESLYENIVGQLPPSLLAEIKKLENQAGTKAVWNLTMEKLTAVLGAIFVAGQAAMSQADLEVQKSMGINKLVMFNGVLFRGASAVLKNIEHPNSKALIDFLGEVAKFVNMYKNELMKTMTDNATANKAQNVAKMSAIGTQMDLINKSIQAQRDAAAAMQAARQKLQDLGIGLMAGGAGAVAAGAALIAAGAAMVASGIATAWIFGIGIPIMTAGWVLISLGSVLAAAGAAMMITGGFMYAQSQGTDLAAKIRASVSEQGQDAIIAVGIIVTLLAAILAIFTFGAATPAAAALGAGVAMILTSVATISTQIWAGLLAPKIQAALENSGKTKEQASRDTAIIMGVMNAAVILLSLGAAAGQTIGKAIVNAISTVGRMFKEAGSGMVAEFATEAGEGIAKNVAMQLGSAASSAGIVSLRTTITNLFSSLKAVAEGAQGVILAVVSAARAVIVNLLKTLQNLLNVAKYSVSDAMQAIQAISNIIQTVIQAVAEIYQGKAYQAQAASQEILAVVNQTTILLNAQIKIIDDVIQTLTSDQSQMENMITKMTQNFQTLVDDLSRAVTAITSNQAAPRAAQTGGPISEDDQPVKAVDSSESSDVKVNLAEMVFSGMPSIVLSTTTQSVAQAQEGYESKFMGTTKPQQMSALMTLLRTLGLKIAEALKESGMIADPRFAEAKGMKFAHALLKQMGMLSKDQWELGDDANQALSKNSLLMTLSFLLAKRGVQPDQMGQLSQLFEQGPENSAFDDQTLGKLIELMEKFAETDANILQVAGGLRKLMGKKTTSPAEFSFEILKLFSSALRMGTADLSGLDDLFGDDESSASTGGILDGDFGDLVDEYFLRGGAGSRANESFEPV